MSDSSQRPNIPAKVIDLLVSDIFTKNSIKTDDVKGRLSEEQKQLLRELVEDLSQKVDAFVESTSPKKDMK